VVVNLVALMRLIFSKAKRRWYLSLLCNLLATAISLVLLVVPPNSSTLIPDLAAILTAALVGVGFWFFRVWERTHALGEAIRQSMMLEDALGFRPDPAILTGILAEVGEDTERKATDVTTAPYYESTAPLGLKRLADHLQESAFWTAYQSCWFRKGIGAVLLVLLLASGAGWYITATGLAGGSLQAAVARLVLALVVALANVGFINWYIRLGDVYHGAMGIVNTINSLDTTSPSYQTGLMRLYSDYNCLLASAYPIPDILYKVWGKRLNDLWRKRIGANDP